MASYDEVLARLMEQLRARTANGETLNEDTDLVGELGLDSVTVMDMMLEIEDEFDITVPLNALADVRTVRDLAQTILRLEGVR